MLAPQGAPVFVWFCINLVAYGAVCGFLVATWALTAGSFEDVGKVAGDVSLAGELGFWPIWAILGWGAIVVIHFGAVLSFGLFGRRARRRRARAAQHALSVLGASSALAATAVASGARHRHHGGMAEPIGPGVGASRGRAWVTVVFVDVVNSTSLNEELGDDEWSDVLSAYRRMVREAVADHRGQEMGTQGDGFLVRFPTPSDGVAAAVDVQRRLAKVREASGLALHVRAGVHAGQVVEDEGDLVGQVVNLAARVTASAGADGIVVTEPVADQMGNLFPLEDLGLRELRGVSRPRHLLAVGWNGGAAGGAGGPVRRPELPPA